MKSNVDLSHLDGYWEIKSVTFKDGTKKEYTFSDTIDFLSLTDSLFGIRKKMKPNFSGYFETSKDSERFEIKLENDSVNVYYQTPYDSWKETILELSESELVVSNKRGAIYSYIRYQPINIE
ncbi:hypothetical protein [Hanstruepera flava]|uniref:hypothetical protein n=1 Tax=Hanstruepera flava TaxID=2930218 RepID=UPI002027FB7F|nr:hypothetical protein [Hanstruepera flava]